MIEKRLFRVGMIQIWETNYAMCTIHKYMLRTTNTLTPKQGGRHFQTIFLNEFSSLMKMREFR